MGLKVSGKIKVDITKEVDGVEYKLTHIFRKNSLTKNGLKLLSTMLTSGCMDMDGKVTDDKSKLAEAGLVPMLDLYESCIDSTEGYDVEDGSKPTDYVDLGDRIKVVSQLVPLIMGRISGEARKN